MPSLEIDPDSDLHLTLVSLNLRRLAERCRSQVAVGRLEVHVIGQVERFREPFESRTMRVEDLRETCVQAKETVADAEIADEVADAAGEGRRIGRFVCRVASRNRQVGSID